MAAEENLVERWRTAGMEAFHEGLQRARTEASPRVSRQLTRFQRWVRDQERRAKRARQARGKRRAQLENDFRSALARGVRRLEEAVRPA